MKILSILTLAFGLFSFANSDLNSGVKDFNTSDRNLTTKNSLTKRDFFSDDKDIKEIKRVKIPTH